MTLPPSRSHKSFCAHCTFLVDLGVLRCRARRLDQDTSPTLPTPTTQHQPPHEEKLQPRRLVRSREGLTRADGERSRQGTPAFKDRSHRDNVLITSETTS